MGNKFCIGNTGSLRWDTKKVEKGNSFLFIYFIYGCVGSSFLCEGFR